MSPAPTVSVCLVCRNEADKLPACLESIRWADEIIVLDLQSSDDSAGVARRHGARVISHERVPVVEAVRNVVADAATGDWVLAMDPDERVTPGLREELLRLRHRNDIDVVAIPFMNYDLGYPAAHPMHRYDPKPRFYRRTSVRWPEVPNALPSVTPDRRLDLPARDDLVMIHDRNRTVAEAIERALRYAPAEAQSMVDRERCSRHAPCCGHSAGRRTGSSSSPSPGGREYRASCARACSLLFISTFGPRSGSSRERNEPRPTIR